MTKLSGGLNNYYVVSIKNPQRKEQEPYQAECEDIIQALGMTFDEGCAFKALWRNAAARMGNGKPGNKALYECEKLVHYANRILNKEKLANQPEPVKKETDFYDWIVTNGIAPRFSQTCQVQLLYHNGSIADVLLPGDAIISWEDIHKYRIAKNEVNQQSRR